MNEYKIFQKYNDVLKNWVITLQWTLAIEKMWADFTCVMVLWGITGILLLKTNVLSCRNYLERLRKRWSEKND